MNTLKAIFELNPTIARVCDGVGFDIEGNEVPFDIEAAKTLANSREYKNQRSVEYPPIGDQLDALFKAGLFPPEMAAQIQAVKDKYPKQGDVNV
jgi:hypothetical protein